MRLIVGGRTCSASASSPSDLGPPKTRTESAESWAGPIPLSRSRMRNRRRRWIAEEWSWSASSVVGKVAFGGSEGEAVGGLADLARVGGALADDAEREALGGRFLRLTGAIEFS